MVRQPDRIDLGEGDARGIEQALQTVPATAGTPGIAPVGHGLVAGVAAGQHRHRCEGARFQEERGQALAEGAGLGGGGEALRGLSLGVHHAVDALLAPVAAGDPAKPLDGPAFARQGHVALDQQVAPGDHGDEVVRSRMVIP